MTVSELIEVLKSFPPDVPVVVDVDGPEDGEIAILQPKRIRFGYAYKVCMDDRPEPGVRGDVTATPEPDLRYWDADWRCVDEPVEGGHSFSATAIACVYLEG